MYKILAIIVTYNPDISLLEENVESILKQVDKLVVFDNGSRNREDILKSEILNNCEIYLSDINVGLGKAYNYWLELHYPSFDYFVTFDQDTLIPAKAISFLVDQLLVHSTIGIIGPVFSRLETKATNTGNIKDTYTIIQSCAIFRMSLFKEIGGFNEDYFIDSVDFEYCLRVGKAGYRVVQFDGILIKHNLGDAKKRFGIKYYSHNSIRHYYITRNHINLSRHFYKEFPSFILKKNFFFVIHVLKVVFLELDINKIKAIIRGVTNKEYE